MSPELAFSHQVSDPHSFLLCLTLSPFFPFILFLAFFPPSSLFIPISYLTVLHVHLPWSPLQGGRWNWNWGQATVFQTAGSDTLVGREINLVGHEINLKGHDQIFFFNGTEENQIEQCPSNIVRVSTICETLYVPVYVCPG